MNTPFDNVVMYRRPLEDTNYVTYHDYAKLLEAYKEALANIADLEYGMIGP